MRKLFLAALLLCGSNVFAADAIVSGNSAQSTVYLFNKPAERMFQTLESSGFKLEEILQGCLEIHSNTIGCSRQSTASGLEYVCSIIVANGDVSTQVQPLCPRP